MCILRSLLKVGILENLTDLAQLIGYSGTAFNKYFMGWSQAQRTNCGQNSCLCGHSRNSTK